MKENKPLGINVGSTSLMMVLAVLCLTIFSVLSLVSANASSNMADATAKSVSDYYAADAVAEEIRAAIAADKVRDGDELYGVKVSQSTQDGRQIWQYTVPQGEGAQLGVVLAAENFAIIKWKSENIGTWEIDNSLPVWDGENDIGG